MHEKLDPGAEPPGAGAVPDLAAIGPEGRAARTALALREATAAGGWTLLDHPMLALDVAGSAAFLEPDAVVVHPDGGWTVVEIKSFPMLDGSADPAKVGAAARQSAVYVLALEEVAARLAPAAAGPAPRAAGLPEGLLQPAHRVAPSTSASSSPSPGRQLARLTRVEDIAAPCPRAPASPPACPAEELTAAVEAVPGDATRPSACPPANWPSTAGTAPASRAR